MTIHPIEVESYRIMDERVDLSALSPPCRAVLARMIHASADIDYATSVRFTAGAVAFSAAVARSDARDQEPDAIPTGDLATIRPAEARPD